MEKEKIFEVIKYLREKHQQEGLMVVSGLDVLVGGLEEAYEVIAGDLEKIRSGTDFAEITRLVDILEAIREIKGYLEYYEGELSEGLEDSGYN